MAELGMLLEAGAVHTGRSARNHLLALAQTNGIGRARVDEVIDIVGLTGVARKRVGGFSLGMGQRLGVAAALLGDPAVVVLDEPVNGLDPEGVLWNRNTLKSLAAEGQMRLSCRHFGPAWWRPIRHADVVPQAEFLHPQCRASRGIPSCTPRFNGANAPTVVAVERKPWHRTSIRRQRVSSRSAPSFLRRARPRRR